MDFETLRQNFKDYMIKRFPNDNYVSSTISMAFTLERYGDEFGIDFEEVLTTKVIPVLYKQKLEELFTKNNRKNPRSNASIYERSLRLLIEYLDGKPPIDLTKTIAKDKPQTMRRSAISKQITPPTTKTILEYLDKWINLPDYTAQEDALNLLFHNTYQHNECLSEVLIKCSTLNDFYGTNIFKVYPLAKHIININIDSRLSEGDPQLVNDIAYGHGIKSRSGKELHLFSFATKYCSHHNHMDFPIFDSYVEKLLIHFRNSDNFSIFKNEELRDYYVFKKVIIDFRNFYQLQEFNLKQIDQYLWQYGKEVFPKQYKKL